jgi:hypothetical protein
MLVPIPAVDCRLQSFESPETRLDAGLMQFGCCAKRSPGRITDYLILLNPV